MEPPDYVQGLHLHPLQAKGHHPQGRPNTMNILHKNTFLADIIFQKKGYFMLI